ncbi:MAG: M1 family metallopeptidase [Hyphomonas sp.]|uniref:M1 family metallopeptidase n=1 Tax=Hyphomonas sp. TaxID=87 RepID=UPI00180C581C|nr:M1 family metallopeptidase [Hyphomonas sp.]MBA3067039.1 M1 family metallopeptidase [Hyphomonas sp.]MBU4063166.1 M1 family metallopeptidase [Alphaproteobacteria bacterium]MBU4164483.1 M1 family metallopeptidase [Alphaproteobacteria bacterium]
MIRSGIFAFLLLALAACAQRSGWTLPVQPASAEQLVRAAPTGRLSGVAVPVAYRATLDLDPRLPRFNGIVEIDITLEAPVTGLWLHGDDLDVSSVTAAAGGETVEASWTEVLETGVVWVGFPKRLEARKLTLKIEYSAPFNANLAGLFKVESQGKVYALAKSESIEARRFMPGFDEPGIKAVFDMSITVPVGMRAVANTPEISRAPARPGFETIRFAPTRPLSTYLLSAAVGDFDQVAHAPMLPNSVRKGEVPLTGYTRAGKGEELGYALSLTPRIVGIFEEMLQQPYPYEKLDLIAAPQWPSGATELAGAITYRESRILKGPNAGPAFIRALKEIHTHEIAHMWFGDLVTPPWWDDLWLKEGFANWSETAVLSILEPDGNHEVAAVADSLSAMVLDSLASARAVSGPIVRNEDIRNAYDAITYSKGQSVIRMVDHFATPERFRPALGRYIARYADGAASSEDFFNAISRATGDPEVGNIFRSFILQQGVPLVEASVSCGAGAPKLTLRQSRYKPLGSGIDPGRTWTIPVCVAWQDGANTGRTCTLLTSQQSVTDLKGAMCPSVIVPNADGAGYYRFGLPPEGWRALGAGFAGLPATEALASLDSAEAAFAAGALSGEDWLGVLVPAMSHPDATVLSASLRAADTLLRQLGDHPAAEDLRARVSATLAARTDAGADTESAARMLSFQALTLDDPAARAELRERLAPVLEGTGGLTSDLYVPALRVTFAEGGAEAFDKILAARARLDDAVFTQAVSDAVGSVADPGLARRAEQLMFDGAFGPAASSSIASSLMGNPAHRETTWTRLTAEFPAFLNAIPSQSRRAAPRLARSFCDPGRIPELEVLLASQGPAAAGHEQALAETKEYLTLCSVQTEAARAAFGL